MSLQSSKFCSQSVLLIKISHARNPTMTKYDLAYPDFLMYDALTMTEVK